MSQSNIKQGMKVRVFRGPNTGIQGVVTRVLGDYYEGGEAKVVFEDYSGEEHSFGGTWVEPVLTREQGKEIQIEDVKVGDEIKVRYVEGLRMTTHSGVVGRKDLVRGVTTLVTQDNYVLVISHWKDTTITLLKAVAEKHELDDAEIGDNFRVFFPSGGSTLYTFLRKGRWVRETYRLDGGLESSATEPDKKAKEVFDKFKTKLTKAVK